MTVAGSLHIRTTDVADAIERYAAAHPNGAGLATAPTRSPDVRHAAAINDTCS